MIRVSILIVKIRIVTVLSVHSGRLCPRIFLKCCFFSSAFTSFIADQHSGPKTWVGLRKSPVFFVYVLFPFWYYELQTRWPAVSFPKLAAPFPQLKETEFYVGSPLQWTGNPLQVVSWVNQRAHILWKKKW